MEKTRTAALIALLAMMAMPIHSLASLVVDLRFTPGTPGILNAHTVIFSPGTYTAQVWAQVRGTDTTGTNESLLDFFGSIQSRQVGGGAIVPPSPGLSGVFSNSGFGPVFTTALELGGRPGTAQNITADNVQDWGTTATGSQTTIHYHSALNSGQDPAFYNSPSVTANLLDEGLANAGVEFEVGRFTITIDFSSWGSGDGVETDFDWIQSTNLIPPPHTVHVDGSSSSESSGGYLPSVAVTNSVAFFILPEPVSLTPIFLTLVALMRRHRRVPC